MENDKASLQNKNVLVFLLALILSFTALNLLLPRYDVNRCYYSHRLYSALVGDDQVRAVVGGNSGYLTFGPYETYAPGKYHLTLFYKAESVGNSFDLYSPMLQQFLVQKLPPAENGELSLSFRLEEEQENMEFRSWYGGQGAFSVEKVIVRGKSDTLMHKNLVVNALLLVFFLGVLSALFPSKEESNSYKRRFLRLLPAGLVLAFILLFFQPLLLVINYSADMGGVTPSDLIGVALGASVLAGLGISLVFALFSGRAGRIAWGFVLALCVGVCLQLIFLNRSYGALNGNMPDWSLFRGNMYLSGSVWVLLFAGACFLTWKNHSMDGIGKAIPCFVALLQLLNVGMTAVSAPWKAGLEEYSYYLSGKGEFTLSEEGNIVTFIIDYCSNEYVEPLLETGDYDKLFQDFCYYDNVDAGIMGTQCSVNRILCALSLDKDISLDEMRHFSLYWDEYWERDKTAQLYNIIADKGYILRYYGGNNIPLNETSASMIGNVAPLAKAERVVDRLSLLRRLGALSLYTSAPTPLKPALWIEEFDFSTLVRFEDGAPLVYENWDFYQALQKQGLTTVSEGKRCTILHLMGTHPVCHTTAHGQYSPMPTTTEEALQGCLTIIGEYIAQMKALGLYDKSTIIIMADHGNFHHQPQVPLFIKLQGESREEMGRSSAPLSLNQYASTLLELMGSSATAYGPSFFAVAEDAVIERSYFNRRYDPNYPHPFPLDNLYERYTYTGNRFTLKAAIEAGPDELYPLFD